MCIGLHVNNLLFFFNFKESLIFSTVFSKNTQISNFKKIGPVGIELFHANRWTDMTMLIVTFHNFANAPIKL